MTGRHREKCELRKKTLKESQVGRVHPRFSRKSSVLSQKFAKEAGGLPNVMPAFRLGSGQAPGGLVQGAGFKPALTLDSGSPPAFARVGRNDV